MKKMLLVTGHLQKIGEEPVFTLTAMLGPSSVKEWRFHSETERSDFLLSRNAKPGDIQFSDDDLTALGIDPKTLR